MDLFQMVILGTFDEEWQVSFTQTVRFIRQFFLLHTLRSLKLIRSTLFNINQFELLKRSLYNMVLYDFCYRKVFFQVKELGESANVGYALALIVGFIMVFIGSYFVLFYTRERATNAKHLQYVSGMSVCIFWFVAFIFDLFIFFVVSLCFVITLVAVQLDGFTTLLECGTLSR